MIGVKIHGVGEVIQPDDPRHPKNQSPEFAPLETTTPTPPEDLTKHGEQPKI